MSAEQFVHVCYCYIWSMCTIWFALYVYNLWFSPSFKPPGFEPRVYCSPLAWYYTIFYGQSVDQRQIVDSSLHLHLYIYDTNPVLWPIPRSCCWVVTYKNLNNFWQEQGLGMGLVPFYSKRAKISALKSHRTWLGTIPKISAKIYGACCKTSAYSTMY